MSPTQPGSRMTRWRAGSLLGIHLLIGLHFAHWKISGRTLAPIEPSEMFDTLHLGIVTVGFLFMAGLVLATSVAGRFFCSWGCHILALQDLCTWILKKLGIRTRPIRSRILLWVPSLAVVYLFVWPQLQRVLLGQAYRPLHVVTDPDGWTSFTTTDLLRSFPGLGMTLFTFALCGFVIVYFLGSRSFCSYACPYGAIFAAADRLAPLRIVAGPGECSQCGLCLSSCKSSIRVIEEVQQFTTVMNSDCMKDLDCVSVCPTGALQYGLAKPPILRSWRAPRSLKKHYDFSLREDLLMAGVFVVTLPVIRGLYDAVSFLLALTMTALLAFFAVLSVRLVRQPRVQLSNFQLKASARLTPAGWAFATLAGVLALFVLHSAFVHYHAYMGERALVQTRQSQETNGYPIDAGVGPIAIGSDGHGNTSLTSSPAHKAALAHLEQAYRWGLVRPPGLRRQLVALYQQSGSLSQARIQLHALLGQDPGDQDSRLHLGRLWLQEGRLNLAKQQFLQVLASGDDLPKHANRSSRERTIQGSAHFYLGDMEARAGRSSRAMRQFEMAVGDNPQDAEAHLALGAMRAAAGHLQEAEASFNTSIQLRPDSAAAYNNLGAILVRLKREEEALEHYRHSLELRSDNPLAYYHVGLLLTNLGKLDEAEETFLQVLALQPDYPPAHEGLALVWQQRGQSEQADWHRQRAAQLQERVQPAREPHGVD